MKKTLIKKNIITPICIFSIFLIVSISIYIYNYTKPYNLYVRALSQTTKEKQVLIQSTLNTKGELKELKSKSIKYSLDRDKKIIYLTKNEDDEETELLVYEKTLYLKIDENKFAKITDSSYLDKFTNDVKYDGDSTYDDFQKQIRDNIDKNNIKKEKIEKQIGETNYELTQLTLTVPKDMAKEIISNYLLKDFNENLESLVNETVDLQETQLLETENPMTNEDKESLKEEMTKILTSNLEEKIKNMNFSDITIKIAIDKKGYIRYREEEYIMEIDGEKSNISNINEYICFGKNTSIIDPKGIEVIDYKDYLEEQKLLNQEKVLKYTVENPNEDIDIQKINQIDDNEQKDEDTNKDKKN